MGSKGIAFIARAREIAAEIVYQIAFFRTSVCSAFELKTSSGRSRLGDRMVSKSLIFSPSRFPPAWSVEGARGLVRGEGERRA